MSIEFFKYQGTGNDFILINNFSGLFDASNLQRIEKMCNRKFGIGADGLMLLEPSEKADFKLIFFNPDASLSFCGNGSRCAVRFATEHCGISKSQITFEAFDGIHTAAIQGDIVTISMRDVSEIKRDEYGTFINTGSPHVVVKSNNLEKLNILEAGSKIRYHEKYKPIGTNVNFVEPLQEGIAIRTYEKGVEDETLSCGTGVTASALVYAFDSNVSSPVLVKTRGGNLKVNFTRIDDKFTHVELVGPAEFVFKGVFNG